MKKLFIIGGMGSGKSSVSNIIAEDGIPVIDLDKVGHQIHTWETVKEEIAAEFGADVYDENGELIRSKLADRAFSSPAETRKLNRITMPRIEDAYRDEVDRLEAEGNKAVVVEFSTFKNRSMSLADTADVVIAVLAPIEQRVERAVAAGWDEADVRRRIALQISDAQRAESADVTFNNDRDLDDLANNVRVWWNEYRKTL